MKIILPSWITNLSSDKKYLSLILVHIILGGMLFYETGLGTYYGIVTALLGILYILWNKNKNHEVLQVAGYLIGNEVLLRMTSGFLNYEFVKCGLVLLAGLGVLYDGFSKKSIPYWIYLLALLPSLVFEKDLMTISKQSFNLIVFDLSGPICLGVMAIYMFDKRLSLKELNTVMIAIGLPILSCGTYVFLYNPDVDTYMRGVCSNPMFSGGFGPNQVATVLGLGMFIFFMQFVIMMNKTFISFINLSIAAFLCYLGLMTFSRGGMITGMVISVVFFVSLYYFSNTFGKALAKKGALFFAMTVLMVFSLITYQTKGLIINRYSNRDHRGNVLKERDFDRKGLAQKQLKQFIDNPVLGTGPGEVIQINRVKEVKQFASHDELTRLLANHGITGLINIMILILTPLVLFFKTRHNFYLAVCFAFWFLSINHSGMRTAAPAFFYALMLSRIDVGQSSIFTKQLRKAPRN